ncbi:MAG: type II toxin-antitoxin system prevent-host-death family antitoxin [Xanthomonadaceae bacterium]|nr:type II toxin-antitoxin system prevent-host-death family antitoxin [Xanthomonadaceae bacterium]
MARMKKSQNSIGIKELKDQASSIVQLVRDTGKSVIITKNNLAIARIEPLRKTDYLQRLLDLGFISTTPTQKWNELVLEGPVSESSLAMQAIIDERESG